MAGTRELPHRHDDDHGGERQEDGGRLRESMLAFLVKRGCDPEQKNAAGKSAIDLYAVAKQNIPAPHRAQIERALGIRKGAKKAPAAKKATKPAKK
ncbi:hypothetical protein [Polyangium fumosum]|uniref:Ankyrin repeat domain-containing protein n=1 Tax=Polyangium fumosum TaxID=889272 RepID=A0A4U1IGY1_9BACT|nr:hypothetical protein [Polyangium fumosum]TKC93044.1 hypothetical protein E8A74_49955 [Polyangium fumosum]